MRELYIFCEGATEQEFCNLLLQPHFFPQHDGTIHTIEIQHSKHHGRVSLGGVPGRYETMRRGILATLKGRRQRGVCFTTMIDIYGLPKDFPGREANQRNPDDPIPYARALETAFGDDINDLRFVPHLQLHEFETILFADPESFREQFVECDQAIAELKKIAGSFPTIEHINDGTIQADHQPHTSLWRPEKVGGAQDRRRDWPHQNP